VEISYQVGKSLDIAVADLGKLVIRLGFATVYHLEMNEVPQPNSSPVAILNLIGVCSCTDRRRGGLCIMLAGRDRRGELLWACSMPTHFPRDDEPHWLHESLLIDPSVVGQTHRITVRISGGLFTE
jgi:hypothetical protein